MSDVRVTIESAEVVPFAAAPMLGFKARIASQPSDRLIHTIALRVQILLEVARRQYTSAEQKRLGDLFGSPERWGQTLRTMLWTHVAVVVPSFSGGTETDILVPCTFDFNVAAAKYFLGLQEGEIPLCFQFSGTIFYEAENGALQVAPIPWDREAKFRLPVRTWNQLMDVHYPNSVWLSLSRDTFERLYQFKLREGLPTWEQVIERALTGIQEAVHP